jgi:putative hydroxymethylpyrimidine transport system substrate-binding protein
VSLLRSLFLSGVIAALLVGCGGGGDSGDTETQPPTFENIRVNLEGIAGPEDAGFVLADKLGYLREAGIGAWINSAIYPERPTKYVDEKLVDAALVYEPQVILAHEEGRQIVIVGSILPEPTMAMIWLPDSNIAEVADLEGKTIAYPGVPFQKDFLEYVLRQAGLTLADVKLEDVGDGLAPALISGRADAIFGGSWNAEGALLESRGLEPVITRVTDLGIPSYDELVLIARSDDYAKDPGIYDRLLEASIRGNEAAGEDPRAATEAIVELSFGVAPEKATEAGVEATTPLLSQSGEVDEARLEDLIEWMYEQGMTKRKLPVSAVLAGP